VGAEVSLVLAAAATTLARAVALWTGWTLPTWQVGDESRGPRQ
jgi:uncharacterized membrane protein YeiH